MKNSSKLLLLSVLLSSQLVYAQSLEESCDNGFNNKVFDVNIANYCFKSGLEYYQKANYTKALQYHNKALVIREKVLGIEHKDTATSYNVKRSEKIGS